jgi:hypothetical protein
MFRLARHEDKRTFRRGRSDEGAPCEIVHDSADDGVGSDSFEQRRAAGHERNANDQDGAEYRDDLLDALFAGTDPGDMLADTDAATRAYAAALDDEVSPTFRTFDFGPQRHNRRFAAFDSACKIFPSPCKGEDEGEGPNSARDLFRARFKIRLLWAAKGPGT